MDVEGVWSLWYYSPLIKKQKKKKKKKKKFYLNVGDGE
jgi:hypothetical protein